MMIRNCIIKDNEIGIVRVVGNGAAYFLNLDRKGRLISA